MPLSGLSRRPGFSTGTLYSLGSDVEITIIMIPGDLKISQENTERSPEEFKTIYA